MRNLKKRTKILIFIFLTSLAALSLAYESILRQIGHFLILEQQPHKADVIVVLNGRDTERSLAAVDLYESGYADLIVMSRGSKQSGSDEFWKRIRGDFNRKIFFQRALDALGIPLQSFKLIGDRITSTYDEAKATKDFLRETGLSSILIVTSKWHSKRAYLTFKSVLKDEEQILIKICPSRYDHFNPDRWWLNESDAEIVFGEYVRLAYYLITLRISPFWIIL